jgi:hypothetical protein
VGHVPELLNDNFSVAPLRGEMVPAMPQRLIQLELVCHVIDFMPRGRKQQAPPAIIQQHLPGG